MKSVWKFPLEITDVNVVIMPKGAKVLTVQMQNGTPTIWALVDIGVESVERRFKLHGTGHNFNDYGDYATYVGTFQDGPFVGHLFEFAF